jgi:hypothetical protein
MKSIILLLILITACDGPREDEEHEVYDKNQITLASKNDFLTKKTEYKNVLYAEKFTTFNFLKEDFILNSKTYLNDNFSFYLPIKNEGKFNSFKIKIFTEYSSNAFSIEVTDDESITFTQFNKENIRFDLLERIQTLEIEILGFDKNENESKSSFYSLKFVPEYEEKFELIIKGTYYYPGGCAGDLLNQEKNNIMFSKALIFQKHKFLLP